jgi:hypothetical protein
MKEKAFCYENAMDFFHQLTLKQPQLPMFWSMDAIPPVRVSVRCVSFEV